MCRLKLLPAAAYIRSISMHMQKPPPRRWGLVSGHMRLGHSPRFHNAEATISFQRAEMHLVREASADFTYLPGNHPDAASLWERTIESRSLASRQEGATAEKAVPFSKLRLSIVCNIRSARCRRVRHRGDDHMPLGGLGAA